MHGVNAMCLINGTKPDARQNLATQMDRMELGESVATTDMFWNFLGHAKLVAIAPSKVATSVWGRSLCT